VIGNRTLASLGDNLAHAKQDQQEQEKCWGGVH